MRCNKCGGDNTDDRRFCQICGHKLQSGRAGAEDAAAPEAAAQEGVRTAGRPASAGSAAGAETDAGAAGQGATDAPDRLHKREPAPDEARPDGRPDVRPDARLLDFQGWKNPFFGLGPYLEACLYAGVLAAAVAVCLTVGILWPLYPLLAALVLVAWLRRL